MEENFTNSSLKETTESFTPLKLRSRVKPFDANNRDDIEAVRGVFKEMGYYGGRPVDHIEGFMMDRQLRSGIESFQKAKGLEIDGTLEPEGETERAVNIELKKKRMEAEEKARDEKRKLEEAKRRIRKEEEEFKRAMNFVKDGIDVYGEYKRLKGLKKNDEEKHRELSCRIAQKKTLGAETGLILGIAKEGVRYL